jgi:hypothetical protein
MAIVGKLEVTADRYNKRRKDPIDKKRTPQTSRRCDLYLELLVNEKTAARFALASADCLFLTFNCVQFISGWGETEPTWHIGHYLACCTSPGCQMMMSVKQSVETEVFGENVPHCHSVHQKSHMARPGLEQANNRLSYGTVFSWVT